MKTESPDFDWPAWLARDDVPPDRKADRLARFVAAHGTLPEGCDFLWSELTKLAGAGRVADALLPRLFRLLPSKTLAALCRSTPETNIRDLVAKLIFLGTSDPSLAPPLSAIVSVLDDDRLASVVRHLGPLAGMYPADEPQMGQRVLAWLQTLPARPERFFQQLAAIRGGARWLPKGVDRVRAWRQFQEAFERFADLCRQMPIVFPGARLVADREAAAQEMVAALVEATPNNWYRDNKQAQGKRRLLDGLIEYAGIPASKLPDDFPEKLARYFATGKWQAPPPPAPVALPPEKEEPINPLTWILPSAVGGLTLVGLFLALAGSWLMGLYRSWQVVPKPTDEPPPHVLFAGAPLPPVKRPPSAARRDMLAQDPADQTRFGNESAKKPPGGYGDGVRKIPGRSGPLGGSPPITQRPVRISGYVNLVLAAPFDEGPETLASPMTTDLAASPLGQVTGVLLRNLPPGECSVHLHGHQQLAAAVRSKDSFETSPLGDLQTVDAREQAGGIEVQARFRSEDEPVLVARFSIEKSVLRYEAGEPSPRVDGDPQVVCLRRALRHCVLEIRPRGDTRSAFLALAKPAGYRFPLDAQGSRVIHAVAQNTLDLPGDADGGQLYLGQGRIVYRRYSSLSFGIDWLKEPAKQEWTITPPAGLLGWDRLSVKLSSSGGQVALAVQPPSQTEPAAAPNPTDAIARQRRIESLLGDARKSIEATLDQRLKHLDYRDSKMSTYVQAAQTLAAELKLDPPPELPRLSSSLRAELSSSSSRGSIRGQAEARDFKMKLGGYIRWGVVTLIPKANSELQRLQREIDGLPSEPASSVMLAQQQYKMWLASSVSVEANIYRLVSCDTPEGQRTLRVLVVAPGSATPPTVQAMSGDPARSPRWMHVAASGRDAILRSSDAGPPELNGFWRHQP